MPADAQVMVAAIGMIMIGSMRIQFCFFLNMRTYYIFIEKYFLFCEFIFS